MTVLARRDGWILIRANSAPVAENTKTKCLNFFREDDDEHWALVFGANMEPVDDGGVMGITYELMWLRSGDNGYSLPPRELIELFEPEIASFVAWIKLTGQWPQRSSILRAT